MTPQAEVPAYQARLLSDAVDQILLQPDAGHRWHTLNEAYQLQASAAALAALSADVLARTPAKGIAGFLRATLLADLHHDASYLAEAGKLLHASVPYDADRVMAYTNYQWGHAVAAGQGHADFRRALDTAGLPSLMRLAGHRLAAEGLRPSPRAVPALRKVALLLPFFGNAKHPPTEMALQHAALLQTLGLDVHLFSCQELLQPQMGQLLGNNGRVAMQAPDAATLPSRLPRGMRLSLSDPRLSQGARWRQMLAILDDYDPDLILFVGLYSPLMQPLYQARPVLGLCLHALAPMAPVDVWLAADDAWAGRAASMWGDSMPPAWGHHHPYRVARRPAQAPLRRAALGLADGQTVLVSAGARLEEEIGGAWAARMLNVLASHPDAVWLLVGGSGALPAALRAAAPGRVRTVPHRTDLGAVLRCCDIYLNPPRVGGGFSAAEAMAEGVPVLALAGADAGSKLGPLAQPDDDAYFAALAALLADPARRAASGAAMRAHFGAQLDLAQSAPSLLQACELAVERYRGR